MMRYIACMAIECKQLREDLQIDFFLGVTNPKQSLRVDGLLQ